MGTTKLKVLCSANTSWWTEDPVCMTNQKIQHARETNRTPTKWFSQNWIHTLKRLGKLPVKVIPHSNKVV